MFSTRTAARRNFPARELISPEDDLKMDLLSRRATRVGVEIRRIEHESIVGRP